MSHLNIPVPNLGGPTITDFWANINNGGLVRTKCGTSGQSGNSTETIKYRTTWYLTGGGTNSDTKTQSCQANGSA